MWFLLYKTQNLCLKSNFKQFAQICGDLTPVKLCWAAEEASNDIIYLSINKVVSA